MNPTLRIAYRLGCGVLQASTSDEATHTKTTYPFMFSCLFTLGYNLSSYVSIEDVCESNSEFIIWDENSKFSYNNITNFPF
jgi:hypothetical protein